MAIAMYADGHQGQCPVNSGTPTVAGSMRLLSNYVQFTEVFVCPSDPRHFISPASHVADLTVTNMSYSYVSNLRWQDTPDSILAVDRIYTTSIGSQWPKDGNHSGEGGNLLFNDGHVSWQNMLPSALKDKDGKETVLSP
jgi:prepilin-type processing-associated H-X9-DG protein